MSVPTNWEDLIGEEEDAQVPDTQKEQIKQRKLIEQSDRELAEDLLDGVSNLKISDEKKQNKSQKTKNTDTLYADHSDPFEKIVVNTHKDAEDFGAKINKIIQKSDKVKPAAMLRFLDLILTTSYPKLDAEHMRILMNHVKSAHDARVKEDNIAKQKPTKADHYVANKYQAEMDLMYGDIEYDEFDEDEYDEDDDDEDYE